MNDTREVVRTTQGDDQDAVDPSLPQVRRTSGLGEAVRRIRTVQEMRQELGQEAEAASGVGDRGRTGANARPRSIVVIDDEPDQVDLTVLLLQAAGHRAIGSTDGSKAVSFVTAEGGEVVILDFMMAGMTGGDVCDTLRSEPTTRNVRIVLLSATPEREIRRSCTQYDTYLSKPTSRAALFRAIEKV